MIRTVRELRRAVSVYWGEVALLIGNGVNRYQQPSPRSWEDLLRALIVHLKLERYFNHMLNFGKYGITLTEIYDLLGILHKDDKALRKAEAFICRWLEDWCAGEAHLAIVECAQKKNWPILTTNFDLSLEKTWDSNPQPARKAQAKSKNGGPVFGAVFPWVCYFAPKSLEGNPVNNFGVWHIHGNASYPRSMRSGLSQYMSAVKKAHPLVYPVAHRAWHSGQAHEIEYTWLDVFLRRKLLVLGLGLDEQEVFLRWLLIQRAKVLRKYAPESWRKHSGWFVHVRECNKQPLLPNKRTLIEGVGLQYVEIATCREAYAKLWQ